MGLRLTDEKKLFEAIDSYSKAIDLFPPFFEAIDNRAFCKMDLGMWAEAIEDLNFHCNKTQIVYWQSFPLENVILKWATIKRQNNNLK